MEQKIKPLTIELDKDLWDKFKEQTPRTITLNEAIVNLISESTKKGETKK